MRTLNISEVSQISGGERWLSTAWNGATTGAVAGLVVGSVRDYALSNTTAEKYNFMQSGAALLPANTVLTGLVIGAAVDCLRLAYNTYMTPAQVTVIEVKA